MMTKPSLKEECCLKVMDEKCLSGPFRISLGGLYARKTRDRMTTVLAKQAGRPEERDTDKKNNQHRILCALLPAEYRLMPDGTDLANLKEASISRFFICAENPDTGKFYSERQYEAVGNNLIDLARKAGFRTGEFTLLPHIRGQLQIMLAELTENERRDFSADAMTLLERLKNKSKKYPDLASHAEGLKKLGTLEEQLAYLTVIALIWGCFRNAAPPLPASSAGWRRRTKWCAALPAAIGWSFMWCTVCKRCWNASAQSRARRFRCAPM